MNVVSCRVPVGIECNTKVFMGFRGTFAINFKAASNIIKSYL